jgi:hypothetical protein
VGLAALAPGRAGGGDVVSTARSTWLPDLHLRLSRRYTLELRATRAAAAGLVASLAGWAIGLDPAAHGVAMLVAAGVGAALPARTPIERAFGWIGQQSGLAYQTHVEHAGRPDPYGLLAEAAVQARLTIRGVTPPPRSPWWLPLAATALAVWLIGAVLGGLGGLTGMGSTGAGGPPPTTAPPPVAAPSTEQVPDVDEPPAADAEREEEPAAPSPQGDGGSPAADQADAPAGEASEGQTVERFLHNLRERPAEPDTRDLEARELERDGLRDDDRQAERPEPLDDPAGDVAGTLRPSPGDPDGDEQTIETDAPGAGEAGREPGDRDEEGELEGAGSGDEDGDEEAAAEQEGDGAAGDGDDPGAAEAPPGEGPPGDDFGEFDAGDGDGAGIGRGAPVDAEGAELDAAGDPEALPGMLLPGAETPGGRVRLPGRDDGHLPEGRSVERYERAVEQAVTDGTVPVPYQEIIRNYFR